MNKEPRPEYVPDGMLWVSVKSDRNGRHRIAEMSTDANGKPRYKTVGIKSFAALNPQVQDAIRGA